MRHRVGGKKLGRKTAHRMMMLRNMVTSLLEKERIRTTLPKAKALRRVAERMITLGKRETLHARRRALAFIMDPAVVSKLFATLAPRFAERPGGYTRIIRLGFRDGDGAQMAMVELVGSEFKPEKAETKGGKKARKTRKAEKETPEAPAKETAKKAKEKKPKAARQKTSKEKPAKTKTGKEKSRKKGSGES